MTFSEIHSKLTTVDSEDLLTSDIFGCCSFLNYNDLLEHVLRESVHFNSKDNLCIPKTVISEEYLFWPRFRTGRSQTEPDVLIMLRHPGNQCTLVLIEAKFNSDKSSEADYTSEDVTDQLARELMIIENQGVCGQSLSLEGFEIASKALIYVTAHDVIPEKALEASSFEFFEKTRCLENASYEDASELPLYWLPWWKIEQLISRNNFFSAEETAKDRIIKHVQEVLRVKKLCRFYGLNPLNFNSIAYSYSSTVKARFESDRYAKSYTFDTMFPKIPFRYQISGKERSYNFGLVIPKICSNYQLEE
ncbi:TPA: hypothetical protein HA338_05795 [Methanosarcina acetivorans]|nr:hypothetical protein [Methanosarcina acetivorans]HIH93555.1 hypothetical protein [Methanosarcina acetivorans]